MGLYPEQQSITENKKARLWQTSTDQTEPWRNTPEATAITVRTRHTEAADPGTVITAPTAHAQGTGQATD